MSINYKAWFKFGLVQGLIEVAIAAVFIALGVGILFEMGETLGFITAIVGSALISMLLVLSVFSGLLAMLGIKIYAMLGLKLKPFWRMFFATTTPGLVFTILREAMGEGVDLVGFVFLYVVGIAFTWATIKVYKRMKWRLPT